MELDVPRALCVSIYPHNPKMTVQFKLTSYWKYIHLIVTGPLARRLDIADYSWQILFMWLAIYVNQVKFEKRENFITDSGKIVEIYRRLIQYFHIWSVRSELCATMCVCTINKALIKSYKDNQKSSLGRRSDRCLSAQLSKVILWRLSCCFLVTVWSCRLDMRRKTWLML